MKVTHPDPDSDPDRHEASLPANDASETSEHIARFDVIIIGAGASGLCTAWFLLQESPTLSIALVEADPSYAFASTPRASGGCRVQFSCPENIRMSLFSIDFIRKFETTMLSRGRAAPIDWTEGGYLFVVPPDQIASLERNVRRQQALGAEVDLLGPRELTERFPSMQVADLGAGAHSPRDGWCDPNGLLWGLRRKCLELGARLVPGRVVAADARGTQVQAVRLEDGRRLSADVFVNATGAWSGEVAKCFQMSLPISPLRRFEHFFTPARPIERLPYVKDTARLAFRSEGAGFSGGLVDGSQARGFDFEVDHDWFENKVWPAVAHRFPAFEGARCHRTWAGLYEQNELDGNPVIGPWRSGLANLHTIAGFSGHGMMHAPAAGRAIAELIVHGSFRTLDLSRFGYERIERGEPYAEEGIL